MGSAGPFNQLIGYTIFSDEHNLKEEACTSISDYIRSTSGIVSAIQYWQAIGSGDNLYEAAQAQIYMLRTPVLTDLLTNGNFETGSLIGWDVSGSAQIGSSGARGGSYCARLLSGDSVLSQTVAIDPSERYRLTVWARYVDTPASWAIDAEIGLEFYNGTQKLIDKEPTRAIFRPFEPADGWTRLRSTTFWISPGAGSAKIIVKMLHNAEVLIDDVKFEKVKGNITLPAVCGDAGTIYHETDLFADCYVNLTDVAEFALSWLNRPCSEPGWCNGADIDKSGEVGFADFAWFLMQWAQCSDPTNGNCGP